VIRAHVVSEITSSVITEQDLISDRKFLMLNKISTQFGTGGVEVGYRL